MEGNRKSYVVELDVLASMGPYGLKKILDGNEVYIDLRKIERRASNRRDPYSKELIKILNWTNNVLRNSGHNGCEGVRVGDGMLYWSKKIPKDAIYLTNALEIESELLRKGKRCERAEFLKFSKDILKSGIVYLDEYSKDPNKFSLEDLIEEIGEENLMNNQFVVIGKGVAVYRVSEKIKPARGNRFVGTGEYSLRKFELKNKRWPASLPCKSFHAEAKNLEQAIAWEQLNDPSVEVSFISGGSGSGKTVITYAAALNNILSFEKSKKSEDKIPPYKGVVLFKPNNQIGGRQREEGFLPGNMFEKTYERLKSFFDAHEFCRISDEISFREMLYHPKGVFKEGAKRRERHKIGNCMLPMDNEAISIEYINFVRGRTFEGRIIFIDEAQNFTPFEMKHLLERVGLNSKIYIVGDPEQVDDPRLSRDFNGLLWAAEVLREHPRVSFAHFIENYRCQTAEIIRGVDAPIV